MILHANIAKQFKNNIVTDNEWLEWIIEDKDGY